jgi:membrane fusion protein (multidrug efflux system)
VAKILRRLLVVLILLGLVFGGIFGWKMQQAKLAAAQRVAPPPATVALTEVTRADWQPRLTAIGTLVANQGVDVTAEVAGSVREILFESGQPVTAGEVLLRLDDSVDEAELRGLLAERDLAAIKYRRLAKLVKERSVSQADVDEAKAQLDSAEAQVATKRAVIEKKAVTAPFAGRLGIRLVDLGEYLAPGAAIVSLQALDPLVVDFSLPERHLRDIAVGQVVEVQASAVPGETFTGRVSAINPGIDVATRTLRVRATLANPELKLRPGMFVEAASLLPLRQGVVTIPQVAVTYNPYGDAVFVAEDKDGQLTAQRRQVTTGTVQGEQIEIVAGLEPGERVVLAGQVKLRAGQAIQIDNSVLPSGGELGK